MGCCQSADDASQHGHHEIPCVRVCAPDAEQPTFADIGDRIVLFADFGPHCRPTQLDHHQSLDHHQPHRRHRSHKSFRSGEAATAEPVHIEEDESQRTHFEVEIGGILSHLKKVYDLNTCTSFRTEVVLKDLGRMEVIEGEPVRVRVPYIDRNGHYRELNQEQLSGIPVYFHSIWHQLKEHNQQVEVQKRLNSVSGRTYQSMGRTPTSSFVRVDDGDSLDSPDGPNSFAGPVDEQSALLQQPVARRYWPDSWEMKCWRSCCDPIMRSQNPVCRFIARFFVTPLTNVTGLSLYYQLYLCEIFHTRFWTRFFHYLCMPLIVLLMMTFFAQWRFYGCYRYEDFSVLILNGAALFGLALLGWYFIWGLMQKSPLMGILMIVPLFMLYILANIYFQVAVKNSNTVNITAGCWDHSYHVNKNIQFYNSFQIIKWYYNPVCWAVFLSFVQAVSHAFEPKFPPRVTQTAHWMDCRQMCLRLGCMNTFVVLSLQLVFGTVDEFLASPRLLPILILRTGYCIGYQPEQWKWMKKLVKRCMHYGDPAIDYIGTGGSTYLPNDKEYIGTLKRELVEMENALTDRQRAALNNPKALEDPPPGLMNEFLVQYIRLRHYVAMYELQVYAYGPFRTHNDAREVELDDERLERDWGEQGSFKKFLQQVRFQLWSMEDSFISERKTLASICCCNSEP